MMPIWPNIVSATALVISLLYRRKTWTCLCSVSWYGEIAMDDTTMLIALEISLQKWIESINQMLRSRFGIDIKTYFSVLDVLDVLATYQKCLVFSGTYITYYIKFLWSCYCKILYIKALLKTRSPFLVLSLQSNLYLACSSSLRDVSIDSLMKATSPAPSLRHWKAPWYP